ncbi:hypothetical protein FQR65_LT04960 [Abscondita terminalis]|nr:hypothetical protein FQR65_LT04960 [Abscondita terminalis]
MENKHVTYSKHFGYYLIAFSIIFNISLTLEDSDYLPNNCQPLQYNLTIEPRINVKTPTFVGSVIIKLKIIEDTRIITLHVKDLNVTSESVTLYNKNNDNLVRNVIFDVDRQFMIIHLNTVLEPGSIHYLNINNFFGDLNYNNNGLYLANLEEEEEEEERVMVVTDFQPTGARTAFPCFDEPRLKSTFIVSVIRSEKYISLSNEELLLTKNLGMGQFQDTFKETVPMSTYLLAIVICEFDQISEERHIMYANKKLIQSGSLHYALKESVELLKALEDYLGINYTLNKMGHVVVPDKYFNKVAMENWGLVIYKEHSISVLNNTLPIKQMQRSSLLIAHELSHQWFGNLVTYKYWNYFWLTEGIATYMQYKILSMTKPRWRMMDQYVKEQMQLVLYNDVGNDVHPLHIKSSETHKLPPSLYAYHKGGAITRMMNHFLTEDVFRRGLQIYLQKNKYKSVEPCDLYQSLQEAVDNSTTVVNLGNNSVASIMSTWDSNLGYPLITVTRNYTSGLTTFQQARYLNNSDTTEWKVPVNYALEENYNFSDTSTDIWLSKQTENFMIPGRGWILVNKHVTEIRLQINESYLSQLGFEEKVNESNLDKLHRSMLISLLGDFGHSEIINNSVDKMSEWKTFGSHKISPDIVEDVFCSGMKSAALDLWQFLYDKYRLSTKIDALILMKALSCSQKEEVLKIWLPILSASLTNSTSLYGLMNVLNNNIGLNVTFQYLKDHPELPENVQTNMAYVLGINYRTEKQLTELIELSKRRNVDYQLGIDAARTNLATINMNHVNDISEWLKTYFANE